MEWLLGCVMDNWMTMVLNLEPPWGVIVSNICNRSILVIRNSFLIIKDAIFGQILDDAIFKST